jgi:hypothetical protein
MTMTFDQQTQRHVLSRMIQDVVFPLKWQLLFPIEAKSLLMSPPFPSSLCFQLRIRTERLANALYLEYQISSVNPLVTLYALHNPLFYDLDEGDIGQL